MNIRKSPLNFDEPVLISVLGGLYIISALIHATTVINSADAITPVIIDFLLLAVPGLVLAYGGYRLPKSDIHRDSYQHILKWCGIGLGSMFAIVILVEFNPDGEIGRPIYEALLASAVGSVSGFAVGRNQAKALTRAHEAERRNQELKQYKVLIEESTDVNAILNTEGSFEYITPSCERVLGHSPEELVGENAFEYIHPDDQGETRREFAKAIETGESETVEFRFKREDGSWAVLEGRCRNLLDDPAIEGIVAYTHDITDRKKLEEELERSNEELEQFAYAASHDLKEPIRTISGYLELLEEKHGDKLNPDARDLVQNSIQGSKRMQRMINDLLEYSRLTTEAGDLESVDMNSVLNRVLENLEAKIEENNAEINSEDLPEVRGNKTQLTQLLQNLIDNSIKYSGDQRPKINISCKERDSECVFAIEDNGVGIESEKQEEIFEVFKRLEIGERRGTGIGLASVKKIVERHDGEIWLKSEPDEGTTFYFTIPTAPSK